MKTLVLLFVSVTVALGMPKFPPYGEQNPVAGEEQQPPVAGDWVPVQGHVVVEHPAPQVLLIPKEQQGKMAPEEPKDKEAKPETKEKPNEEQDLKPKLDVRMEEEFKLEQEPEPVEEKDVEEPDFQAESEVKVEVEEQPRYELEEEEDKIDPGFRLLPDAVPGAQMELEPPEAHALNEVPERGAEERHIDMEGKPVMELEPLEGGDVPPEKTEMSEEEMAYREAFQEQDDAAVEYLPEEKEEEEEDRVDGEEDFRGKKKNYVSDEQQLMEPDPELTGEQHPEDTPVLDEGPLEPELQQTMPLSRNYFQEAGMEMYAREPGAPEEYGLEDESLPMMMGDESYRQGERYCPGIITDGKCYQFFTEPKRYEDAEFFCQEQFPGGHLASITSLHVHQELMRLIQQGSGYTRTWVGGRRLDSRRFVWLDGSRWSYEDWLPGEPNNTAGVENCLEILGNGKFNDFTCWEPEAFVCSYPSQ